MLHETYRPTTWDDVVGQDKIIAKLAILRQRSGLGGRAYWLTGSSGTGKTTIARLIAQEVADTMNITETVARGLSPRDIEDISRQLSHYGLGEKSGQAIIINEAHGLSRAAIEKLLESLEKIPQHVVWVFTTTNDGESRLFDDQDDAQPMLSRCTLLPLSRRDLAEAMARRLADIGAREGLCGADAAPKIKRALADARNNMRQVWQRLEAGDFREV